MKQILNCSAYKSNKAREKAIAVYDNILMYWPVPYQARYVDTNFGTTHIIVSGSPQAKPLILLHGGGGNSTMWLYNVAALSQTFCVYAIDIIGEAGKSAGTRPLYKSGDHAHWLNEVLNGLGLDKAAICGASLGGMIAHMFALQYPQSVTSLVLLAPPSLLKMRPSFLFCAILANIFPTTYFTKKFLSYISSSAKNFPPSAVDAFVIQVQSYRPNLDAIPIISDHELSQLSVKTLVLIGDDEVLYNPLDVAERIHAISSSIEVDIIPGAKHTISVDRPDLFSERLIQFIGGNN